MAEFIRVGMSEIVVSRSPDVLAAIGLGSCVGVCVYDPVQKSGGMAHIMLPKKSRTGEVKKPGKFADTAIPELLEKLKEMGVVFPRVMVKVAGGAQMFSGHNDRMMIGLRNVQAVERLLAERNLKITGKNVGGKYGRSVRFDLATGVVSIKMLNSPEIIL